MVLVWGLFCQSNYCDVGLKRVWRKFIGELRREAAAAAVAATARGEMPRGDAAPCCGSGATGRGFFPVGPAGVGALSPQKRQARGRLGGAVPLPTAHWGSYCAVNCLRRRLPSVFVFPSAPPRRPARSMPEALSLSPFAHVLAMVPPKLLRVQTLKPRTWFLSLGRPTASFVARRSWFLLQFLTSFYYSWCWVCRFFVILLCLPPQRSAGWELGLSVRFELQWRLILQVGEAVVREVGALEKFARIVKEDLVTLLRFLIRLP